MPRYPSEEVATIVAPRLHDRGNPYSVEWLRSWCLRWGKILAEDTKNNPVVVHKRARNDKGEVVVLIGVDQVPEQAYREWRHFQNKGSTVHGTKHGDVYWVD